MRGGETTWRHVGGPHRRGLAIGAAVAWLMMAIAPARRARAATLVRPVLEVGTGQRYDDEPAAGHPELYTKLSPKGGVDLSNERLALQGWYAADLMYRFYDRTPAIDHRARLSFQDAVSRRLTLRAEGSLWRVQDPTSLPRLGVVAIRVPVLYGVGTAGLVLQLSHRWTWELDDRNEVARIFAPGYVLGVTQSPSTDLRYAFGPRTTGGIEYRYQVFLGDGALAGQAHAALLTATHRLSKAVTGKLEGGPILFGDGHAWTPVPRIKLELDYEGKATELGVVAERDVAGAVGYAAAVWADYGQLAWAWHPTRAWRANAMAGLFRNGLAPDAASSVSGYAVGAGASYAFTASLRLELSVQRLSQLAVTQKEIGLNRNIAAVGLSYVPALSAPGR